MSLVAFKGYWQRIQRFEIARNDDYPLHYVRVARWRRFVIGYVDSFIPAMMVLYYLMEYGGDGVRSLGLFYLGALFLVRGIPTVAFGRSLGHILMGAKIISYADGVDASVLRRFLRCICWVVAGLPVLELLNFALVMLRSDRRGLHDLMAGTAVAVRNEPPPSNWRAQTGRFLLFKHRV